METIPPNHAGNRSNNSESEIFNPFWLSLVSIPFDLKFDIRHVTNLVQSKHLLPSVFKPGEEVSTKENEALVHTLRYLLDSAKSEGKNEVEIKVKLTNLEINRNISIEGLTYAVEKLNELTLESKRNDDFIYIISFTYLVSLFDAAILDILRILYKYHPETLFHNDQSVSTQSVNYLQIFNADSLDKLKDDIIEKEIYKFGFKSIREQLAFFGTIINRPFFSQQIEGKPFLEDIHLIGAIVEIRESRNLYMHNKGRINEQYFQKIYEYYNSIKVKKGEPRPEPNFYLPNIGEYKTIDSDYINNAYQVCIKILSEIAFSLIDKFVSKKDQEQLKKQDEEFNPMIEN
jgi:hypothetical protein